MRRRAREPRASATFLPVVVAPDIAQSPNVAESPSEIDVFVELGGPPISLRGAVSVAHVEAIVRGLASRC